MPNVCRVADLRDSGKYLCRVRCVFDGEYHQGFKGSLNLINTTSGEVFGPEPGNQNLTLHFNEEETWGVSLIGVSITSTSSKSGFWPAMLKEQIS